MISVSFKDIKHVPFPDVTVCPPNSGKWSALVKALNHFDKDGLIHEFVRKYNEKDHSIVTFFLKPYFYKIEEMMTEFDQELALDRDMPERLNLSLIEEEIFYLLHYACYSIEGWKCYLELVNLQSLEAGISHHVIKSIIEGDSREKTAKVIKEVVCQIENVDCSVINNSSWMTCSDMKNEKNSSIYTNWCHDCKNLTDCILSDSAMYSSDLFVQQIVLIFQTWRKYITKEQIISSLISCQLSKDSFSSKCQTMDFEELFAGYITEVKPFSNSSLNLLDVWSYVYGEDMVEDEKTPFYVYLDKTPIEAMKNCTIDKTKESCQLVEKFSKTIWNHEELWSHLYQNIFDDFIPLCNYATDDMKLFTCTTFKKTMTHLQQSPCYTFNESSFTPKLGLTQGLSFLVNYDYPGTFAEMEKPITVILHQNKMDPDIKNIKGKNFYIDPGSLVNLRMSTTIVDTTEDFDKLKFETRLCDNSVEEIGCINEKIVRKAISDCGCTPWFLNGSVNCETLGIKCYQKSIEKSVTQYDLQNDCYPACKRIKYSLVVAEQLPMTDEIKKLAGYGEDTVNFIEQKFMGEVREYFWIKDDFLEFELKMTSLIRINFEDSEVLTVTKDAKITIPDMIGNIGGTLGVFIGFSFLGLLDYVMNQIVQFIQRRK